MGFVRGITFILQAIMFRIVPTALEISLVCGILVRIILKQVHLSDIMSSYILDVQLWLEFCGDYISDNGSLHLVYRTNDRLEVRVVHILRHDLPWLIYAT